MTLADFLLVPSGEQEQQMSFETHEIYQNMNRCFTVREIKHWHRLPGEAVESPCLGIFISGWREL